jgi:hypothetical protein
MTIIEAINAVDTLKPNTYTYAEKIRWLSALDGTIKKEIIDTHEGGDGVVFEGYNADTPLETELLVAGPYNEVYIMWLEAQIDYANQEYDKYNNSMMMYNNSYNAFWRYYNRTHLPISKERKYF